MSNREIKNDIQIDIIKYLEYQNNKEKEKNEYNQIEQILKSLSPDLKQSIYNDFYGAILKKFTLFKNNFSDKFILSCAMKMNEVKLAPGDELISSSEKDQDSLFYIKEGLLELSLEVGSKFHSVGTAMTGEFIGKINFFTETTPKIYMKSQQLTHIILLKK